MEAARGGKMIAEGRKPALDLGLLGGDLEILLLELDHPPGTRVLVLLNNGIKQRPSSPAGRRGGVAIRGGGGGDRQEIGHDGGVVGRIKA